MSNNRIWSQPKRRGSLFPLIILFFATSWLSAQVERIEITIRQTVDQGKHYGLAGAYEIMRGKAYFALDPKADQNRVIADLDHVAREPDGLIRYSADFYILKPVEAGKGNGGLLLDIPNRGNPTAFSFNFPDFQLIDTSEPPSPMGDGFLMERGLTVAGLGWQADIDATPSNRMRLYPPVTHAVRGLVRSDAVFSKDVRDMPLGHWGHVAYPATDPENPKNELTVRDSRLGKRTVIPRSQWRFGRWVNNKIVPGKTGIALIEGVFEKGKIYEAVYVSENPPAIGLGMTGVRDFASFLRHDEKSPISVKRIISFGGSQSGRFLRHFLHLGLTTDLEGRPSLDGIYTSVAGAGRGGFNHRFGQPSRAEASFLAFFYPTDLFPFTCLEATDHLTGKRASLLDRAKASGKIPKIVQVNTGYEYWGRAGSLIHATTDGEKDAALHPNERIYHLAGNQHFPGPIPPAHTFLEQANQDLVGRYPTNPVNFLWFERALLIALDRWVAGDAPPPPSKFPTLAQGALIAPEHYNFPAIPGVSAPRAAYRPLLLDFGPDFETKGVIDLQPPKPGEAYRVLVPKVDADGNEIGGLRFPEIEVPVATYVAWNWRAEKIGAPNELVDMAGSFFPFPRTKAEREANGDPRISIEERYANRSDYIGQFTEVALKLIHQRYLLAEDLPKMIRYANALWDLAQRDQPADKP